LYKKIIIALVGITLLVGILSGCTEPPATNNAPEASFTITPDTGIYRTLEITFTDASEDEDGTVSVWSWDFDGDGVEDSNATNPTYTFDTAGTHTVSLIVTDEDGDASDAYTMDITVGNIPPMVTITYDHMVNITNTTQVTLTAAVTVGDAENISSYSWDFDADGVEDANTSETTYIFTTIGDHVVAVTVTDEDGLTGTDSETITVTEE
jgi:PKD repeat protein